MTAGDADEGAAAFGGVDSAAAAVVAGLGAFAARAADEEAATPADPECLAAAAAASSRLISSRIAAIRAEPYFRDDDDAAGIAPVSARLEETALTGSAGAEDDAAAAAWTCRRGCTSNPSCACCSLSNLARSRSFLFFRFRLMTSACDHGPASAGLRLFGSVMTPNMDTHEERRGGGMPSARRSVKKHTQSQS